jgi:hypothetical protein
MSEVWEPNNQRPLSKTMQPKLHIAFGSLQSGRWAARGHLCAQKQNAAAVYTCVSGALYVLVNTACAVTERGHKIFDYTGYLVRKQTFQTVLISANIWHIFVSLRNVYFLFAFETNDMLRQFKVPFLLSILTQCSSLTKGLNGPYYNYPCTWRTYKDPNPCLIVRRTKQQKRNVCCALCSCVLCTVHSAQHTTHIPLCDMLPHHQITYNDVIWPSVLI